MGRVVLDTGALIAWEAGTRTVRALIEEASGRGHDLFVPAGVLAQYWRGGSGSQVRVARLLKSCELDPLTPDLARSAGVLLGRSGTADVVDACVAILAAESAAVLTSDPGDIGLLLDVLTPSSAPRVIHV